MKYYKLSLLLFSVFILSNCSSDPDTYSNQQGNNNPGTTLGTIATVDVTDITISTAVSGGIITSDGGSPIIDKGIVWSLSENPTTILGTKTIQGEGMDAFVSNMTDLESNKTYYVRAYARNGKGVAYGQQIEFETPVDENSLPRVTTAEATIITTNSVKTGGNVTSSGISPVTNRGVVWGLAQNPTIMVNLGMDSSGSGLGAYVNNLTNLIPNTTYYLRAFATSAYGTNYGEQITFSTNQLLYTVGTGVTINGTFYGTVKLNNQEWTTKNLAVTKYRNGDVIPQVQDATQWAALTTGAWCNYSYSTSNGTVYGKLYNWYAVNDPRGITPTGWHVPTNDEWASLTDFLGGSDEAGGLLKEAGTTHWQDPNTGATNASGIKAFPGGYCLSNGTFSDINTKGYWWTSDSYNPSSAWCTGLFYNTKTITRAPIDKRQGFSVRIIKN